MQRFVRRSCLASSLTLLSLAVTQACGSDEPSEDPVQDAGSSNGQVDASRDAGPTGDADAAPRDGEADAEVDAALDATDDADNDAADASSWQSDGLCAPAAVTTGVYDPDCVYVVGTRLPGSAGWDVLIDPSAPTVQAHGFGNYFSTPGIRPQDGRLVFRTYAELYWFTPDSVALGSPAAEVLANDTLVATPGCPQGVARAFVFPDDGAIGYQCFQSVDYPNFAQHLFVEGSSEPLASGGDERPIAVGPGRSALFRNGDTLRVFDGAEFHAISGAGVQREAPAVRFRDGAFLVAAVRSFSPQSIELLQVSLQGAVRSVGFYRLDVPDTVFSECVLEPNGALVCFTGQLGPTTKVTRFTLDAAPATIYDPTGNQVALHIPHLVTGP